MLHFNARSVKQKWEEISAELYAIRADIICITESWLSETSFLLSYCLNGYRSYFNSRQNKRGGGAMILVKDSVRAIQISEDLSPSNLYNVCAIKIFGKAATLMVAAVYRAPKAPIKESCECFDKICNLCHTTDEHIILGDLNLPDMEWSSCMNSGGTVQLNLKSLMCEFNLTQINVEPTRLSNVLNVAILSPRFVQCKVEEDNPIAGSDHTSQRLAVSIDIPHVSVDKFVIKIDVNRLIYCLSLTNWNALFIDCKSVNDFAQCFQDELQTAISNATYTTIKCTRQNLPKHILKLIHRKRQALKSAKRSGDFSQFEAARRLVRTDLRAFRKQKEKSLMNRKDRKNLFKYINSHIKGNLSTVIKLYDGSLTDAATANVFSNMFCKNFGRTSVVSVPVNIDDPSLPDNLSAFSCDMAALKKIVLSARNSAAGPDGFSMSIIKQIFHCISYPLLVIFQQSLHQGVFPTVWKAAYIASIYKNKGDKCDPSSYRPMSLCSCFGKILERLVKEQLIVHLNKHFPLQNAQHGFIMG